VRDAARRPPTDRPGHLRKLGRNSVCSFAAVHEVDQIITDARADPELGRGLAAAGPDVVLV
jgi:DeoR family fructose operon transcriptional repressor